MPKKRLTAEVAGELATLAVNGRLLSLKIDKYKSGENKGQHYADYREGERTVDINTIRMLQTIHRGMEEGKSYDIYLFMNPNEPTFMRVVELKGEEKFDGDDES